MRLQLTLCLLAATAGAQELGPGKGSVTVKGSVYADDDRTLISTTIVDGEVGLPGKAHLEAHALLDIISSASVDVVSAASPRGEFEDARIEAGVQAGMRVAEPLDLTLGFTTSNEEDWRALGGQMTWTLDVAKKNGQATLGYGYFYNQVGRRADPNFSERQDSHTVEAGYSQLLDKKTVLGVTYTLQVATGFQSSPYRYVTTAGGASVLEAHPDLRSRHALTASLLRSLTDRLALESSYRFYGDDWGVLSHTATAALRIKLGEQWDARLRARAYYQSAASFWRERYDDVRETMSVDRELSTFWDAGGGLKVGWHGERWSLDAKVEATYYGFLDFARLASRVAIVTDLGAGFAW